MLGVAVVTVEDPAFASDGGVEVEGTVDGTDGALQCLL